MNKGCQCNLQVVNGNNLIKLVTHKIQVEHT